MNEHSIEDKPAAYVPMAGKQLVRVALVGAIAGLVTWGMAYLLDMHVLKMIACQGTQVISCSASAQYAEIIASVLAASLGLFALIKLQVFRPLLVILGTVISMWGLVGVVSDMPLYASALSCVLLYMFAYTVFTWIARLRLFWLVVVLLLVIIISIRLILTS